jgi:hypothetical protein
MAATKESIRKAAELRAVYTALDGREFANGGQLSSEIFKTYQRLFTPTMALGEYAAMLMAGQKRGWVITGPGAACRVSMPADAAK